MSEKYRKTDEELVQGVKTGVRTGNTARNAVSAVRKAAAGNYVGAAINIKH